MTDYNLPSGYAITVSDDGLSKLSFGSATIGEGPTQIIDGSWFYRTFDPLGYTPTLATKAVTFTATGAIVTHSYTGLFSATVVYTYTVSGNDIHISALVYNTGSKPIQPAFKSMRFLRNVSSGYTLGLSLDSSYTQGNPDIWYPSTSVPYAASVLSQLSTTGPQINVATWSEEAPDEKFMSMLINTFQLPGNQIASIFFNSVPPGGSRIYRYVFRFSDSTDWTILLSGYKSQLRAVFPTLVYEPDARPLVQFAAIDSSYIRPDNPYGYNDGGSGVFRRFDTLAGCQDYVSKLTGPMTATGYQGIVLWQPQGINPRGVQYRPDFNVFPPEIIPNLPTLVSGFRNANLNIGLLARPASTITSSTWTTDTTARTTDQRESIADLKTRIQWALGQNFNAFYLDSFLHNDIDHNILKVIRTTIGSIHTFTEFSTALSMAYSAAYQEITWNNGIVLTQTQQILRWLWPDSIVATLFQGALPPGGYAQLYPAMFDLKLTPLIEDYRAVPTSAGSENSIIQPLVASRIGPNHRWL